LAKENADRVREAAMLRPSTISDDEIAERRAKAALHYASENTKPDADMLADHALYILGKMSMDEYEQYLLLKHSAQ